jgi:hypothetical protein
MTDTDLGDMYETMPDEVLKVKDEILDDLGGERTHVVIMALMSALIEVIIRTAPSKECAIETSAGIALSMEASIRACDEAGAANWSDSVQ